ncbi:YxeA family protein [Lactococcus garvieae]|uniref:YxeA family protein n=1 Tax=Lactococcus garvieae TaxID=1363 RepID=UPI001F60955D|nr:YxeA family protein [Lactococcus garvieae]MCI3861475.1 YxeA family protein [Lactococcus garvieae]
MKKMILVYIGLVLTICASGYSWYNSNYKGNNYYAFISDECKPITEKETYNQDVQSVQYTYLIKVVNEKGDALELKLNSLSVLKPNTYLEIFHNKKKNTTNWVEVDEDIIPKNALSNL